MTGGVVGVTTAFVGTSGKGGGGAFGGGMGGMAGGGGDLFGNGRLLDGSDMSDIDAAPILETGPIVRPNKNEPA